MTVSRRSALSVLGLASVAAIAPEDFSNKIGGGETNVDFGVAGIWNSESAERTAANLAKMTAALRRLADDIDAGGTLVQGMKLTSEVKPDDFLFHTLSIDFVLREPPAA